MGFERDERYSSIVLILFSLFICFMSFRLGLGTVFVPRSGFFPFWAGVILGLLSLANLLIGILKSRPSAEQDEEQREQRINWKNLFLTFIFLLVYPLLMSAIGFLLSTFLFFSFFLYFVGDKSWGIVFSLSATVAAVTFLIFQYWLKIQFPVGILGI